MGVTHFGPYRLDAVLHRGGSATVYRARDTSHHDRVVALKVFDQAPSADPVFQARFRRDAGLLSALREPHVVPIHRHGEIDGRLYLDMRLVRGPSLADVLRGGPLAPPRAAAIAGQIGAAVESLRLGGLGERPLERTDVLLTGPPGRGEFVQLVGFGLGRDPVPGAVSESPVALVTSPARRRRGRLLPVAGIAVVAAVLATLVAVVRGVPWSPDPPVDGGPPALVATINGSAGGSLGTDTTELDGKRVLVATAADGSIHTWDLATGEAVRPAIASDALTATAATHGGRTFVVVRHRDASVRGYDLATGAPAGPAIGPPQPAGFDQAFGAARVTPATAQLDGRPVVLVPQETGGSVSGPGGTPAPQVGLQAFALPGGEPAGPLVVEDGYSMGTYTTVDVGGRPAVVSVTGTGRLQAKDLATGARVGVPTAPQPVAPYLLATGVRDGAPVVITGGADNVLRIWNPATGEQVGPPLAGHTTRIAALATVRLGARDVVISATSAAGDTDRAEVRFWDLATGAPLGRPLVDHPLAEGFVAGSENEPALLVAASPGKPITVWDARQLVEGVAS